MGFAASWICARGIDRASMLEVLGLREAGGAAEIWRTPFSCAELPDGWLAVSTTNSDWLLPQKVKAVSTGGMSVGCFMSDYVMLSGACAYDHGRQLWWLLHEPEEDVTNLTHGGELPASFEAIKDAALEEQRTYKPDPYEADFVFDVPMQLVASICGFRADEEPPASVRFTELRETVPIAAKPAKKSLFGAIGGLFGR